MVATIKATSQDSAVRGDLHRLRIPPAICERFFALIQSSDSEAPGLTLNVLAQQINNFIEKELGQVAAWSQARLSALKSANPARRMTLEQFLMICKANGRDPLETCVTIKKASCNEVEKAFMDIVEEAIKILDGPIPDR